jgi:hypothetical protein
MSGEPGKMEKYLPWYGAAGAGLAASELGGRLMPKRYAALGRVGGALAGTAAGVHGGEAAGRLMDKRAAEEVPKKSKFKEVAKTVGSGLAGMAAGTAAGYGAGHLADAVALQHLHKVAPILGAGLGTSYALWKSRERNMLNDALEG